MPTVLVVRGLRFVIYFNDHDPPHVHVFGDDATARFTIESARCLGTAGFSFRDLRKIQDVIKDYHEYFEEKWEEIHGEE